MGESSAEAEIGRSETKTNTVKSGTSGSAFNKGSRERLEISDVAIDKIAKDVLGGVNGLAAIFAGENNAGIFNSSVSAQAAGDLAANLIGEIAKLRAEKVKTEQGTSISDFQELFKGNEVTRDKRLNNRAEFGL